MAQGSEHQQHQVESTNTLTFDPFTRHQFYTDVNRALVERTLDAIESTHPSGEPLRIVELASGTGAVTQLILDALAQRERPAVLVGVDPSRDAIHHATQRFAGRPVSFVLGDARALGPAIGKADAAFFCNAIHLIPDKDGCLAALADALHLGGVLAFNTTFYDGAYVAGSEPFYYALTRRSIGWLREHHPEVRLAHRGKVTARQWLAPQEYRALVGHHGFAVSSLEEVPVRFPLSAVQDIGRYPLFIEGALPGVPEPIGADALEAAAALAFDDLHLEFVPRNWLQLVAHRTS
jgi:ubiquinone/menaquinone biosynthesis C-methylase UbiE